MENFNALLTLSELKTLYSKKPVGICPLYKGSIGATKAFEATGNPVVIPKYEQLEKLAIEFLPKQAGSGDPSPDNVRPITGRDEVTGMGSKEWGYIASYNGESLPGEWISDRDVYAPGTTPTTGAQVAYKLATPEPFKTSQYSIPSLGSENTIFTNGENMDIIYKVNSFWG